MSSSPCERLRCDEADPRTRLCPHIAECHHGELRAHGSERRHLGWRFVDATVPLARMAWELNATVPPASRTTPYRPPALPQLAGRIGRVASLDGTRMVEESQAPLRLTSLYMPVLSARHRALTAAWDEAATRSAAHGSAGSGGLSGWRGGDGASLVVARQLEAAMRDGACADFRWYGTPTSSPRLGRVGSSNGTCSSPPLAMAEAAQLRRRSEVDAVDYGPVCWDLADTDARRLPTLAGWPRHSALLGRVRSVASAGASAPLAE